MRTTDIAIFSPRIARDLIKNNFIVKDIRPNTNNRDKTVFYFEGYDKTKDFLKQNYHININ